MSNIFESETHPDRSMPEASPSFESRWKLVPAHTTDRGEIKPDELVFGGTLNQPCTITVSAFHIDEPAPNEIARLTLEQAADLAQAREEAYAYIRIMHSQDRQLSQGIPDCIAVPKDLYSLSLTQN